LHRVYFIGGNPNHSTPIITITRWDFTAPSDSVFKLPARCRRV
jgi:hypothetical protein